MPTIRSTHRDNTDDWVKRITATITGSDIRTRDLVYMEMTGNSGKRAIPRQALIAPENLVGRDALLTQLTATILRHGAIGRRPSLTILTGAPGVGKTALANYWAHKNEHYFPDGTLYANLRGFDPGPPVDPADVLTNFLRALSVPPGQIPTNLDGLSSLFRTTVAPLRLLILLDNAHSASQVKPLLASGNSCATIVTSRNQLSSLVSTADAVRFTPEILSEADSTTLVKSIVGHERLQEDLEAASEIIEVCGGLPLALRIAAEVIGRTRQSLAQLANDLKDRRQRLDFFENEDHTIAVRTIYSWSYQQLHPPAAKLFRLLSLHPPLEFGAQLVKTVLSSYDSKADANDLLQILQDSHLIEASRTGRFRFHDLIRAFAYEQTSLQDSSGQRKNAVRAMTEWYLYSAAAADRLLVPDLPPIVRLVPKGVGVSLKERREAIEWSETERANVVSMVSLANEENEHTLTWQLALVPWGFYELRKYWADWIQTHQLGLEAARVSNDALAEAMILNSLGIAYRDLRRLQEALRCFRTSMDIRERIGDLHGVAINLNSIGITKRLQGEYSQAIEYGTRSLELRRSLKFKWGEAHCLADLGLCFIALEDYETSRTNLLESLEIWREVGAKDGEATSMLALAEVSIGEKDFQQAIDWANEAIGASRTAGSRYTEAMALRALAKSSRLAKRKFGDAFASLEQSLRIQRALGDQFGELESMLELTALLTADARHLDARHALAHSRKLQQLVGDSRTGHAIEVLAHAMDVD